MEHFIEWVERVGRQAAADRIGCSVSMVGHWLATPPRKGITPEQAIKIETASAGEITCEELRPDLRWVREGGAVVSFVTCVANVREAAQAVA